MKNGKRGKQVAFNPEGGDPDLSNMIPTGMAPHTSSHYKAHGTDTPYAFQNVKKPKKTLYFHKKQDGNNRGVRYLYGIRESVVVHCPRCNRSDLTVMSRQTTRNQWMCACCCCMFGLIPCLLTPFFIKDCYMYYHYCQHCGKALGNSSRTSIFLI